ncbi:pseudouridine synthase DEG1 [Aspergillus melleus]|uniref:pseudouridine synthase DEG1 n=1 Tax=Aspergillus melleus TaxID=138277 RepID=UPI001E8D9BDF|nr:pseudouridine synthase deg1 [Aspergillus melleus]KAH8424176.1 pseudouridine synthase deg1 [Aspergillus melleus]
MWKFQLRRSQLITSQQPIVKSTISRSFQSRSLPHLFASVVEPSPASTMSGTEGAAAQLPPQGQSSQTDYSTWSAPDLISRISELEKQLQSRTAEFASDAAAPTPAPSSAPTANPATAQETSSPNPSPHKKAKPNPPNSNDDSNTTEKKRSGFNKAKRPSKQSRELDPSKYHTRFIALKFAYLGQRYNGLEHTTGNVTPLPTIEEELWKAFRRTRLILPTGITPPDAQFGDPRQPRVTKPYELNWEGCQYSKAGRTDRGVSAFGQVIGIRVRSSRPKKKVPEPGPEAATADTDTTMKEGSENQVEEDDGWDDIADELPYITILNSVLPEDIRVLAWCPHPPEGFDARFSCRERHYKYFFTQPAFFPTPGGQGLAEREGNSNPKYREGYLDIEAMRNAAKLFEGVHDFRNFCKLDTSKQLDTFERRIFHSDIELVDPNSIPLGSLGRPGLSPDGKSVVKVDPPAPENVPAYTAPVYVFHLQGSAFLWHQVRLMVSILFLVGQGFESPSIVSELLDITKNPRKPSYTMASDAPLVLWDCVFPDLNSNSRLDALDWVYAGDPRQIQSNTGKGNGKFGLCGVVEGIWSTWRQRKIDEILAGALLNMSINQGDQRVVDGEAFDEGGLKRNRGQKVFIGGNDTSIGGKYIPIMQLRRNDPIDVQNARYRVEKQRKLEKKAAEAAERMEM